MDETMMRLGGEAKRRQLIEMFGEMTISGEGKGKMSAEEAKIAREGDIEQSKFLT